YPGEFLAWIRDEWDQSEDTAERKMNVARLGKDSALVRNLNVSTSTFYQLVKEKRDCSEEVFGDIVAALAKASQHRHLKRDEARAIIERVHRVQQFGPGLPDATMEALENLDDGVEWHEAADKTLREAKPDDKEAATKIVRSVQRAYL